MADFGMGPLIEWGLCALPLVVLGVVIAIVKSARKQSKQPPAPPAMKRCATCDQLYDATYDACPHCARKHPIS